MDGKDEIIAQLKSEHESTTAAWESEKGSLVSKSDLEAKEAIIATLTAEKDEAVASLSKAKEEVDSQLSTLQQELEAEKTNHAEITGKLSSKDQEFSKLQEEHDARGVESEGHKSRVAELEAVSHSLSRLRTKIYLDWIFMTSYVLERHADHDHEQSIATLEAAKGDVSGEIAQLQKSVAEKDEALQSKLAELESAQKEAADKAQELQSATEAHETTRTELQTHQARVTELEEQLKELEAAKKDAADKAEEISAVQVCGPCVP